LDDLALFEFLGKAAGCDPRENRITLLKGMRIWVTWGFAIIRCYNDYTKRIAEKST